MNKKVSESMHKRITAILIICICSLLLAACEKSSEPIDNSEDDNSIIVNESYEYFDLKIDRFEDIINVELVDYLPEDGITSFKKTSDLGFTADLQNDLYVFVVVSEENENIWRIAIGQDNYTEETDQAKEIGEITRIFSNLLHVDLTNSKMNELIDRYTNCYDEEEGFHGSLVADHVLFEIALEKNVLDEKELELSITPSEFASDEEYQESSDFNDYKIRYCPALVKENNAISEDTTRPEESEPVVDNENPTTKESKYYGPGMYKVGIDIPAGEYNVKAELGELGYLEVSNDPNGTSIITTDAFENNSYVSVSDGQYLVLENCYINQ